ncbi:unnamed protein product [Paramecium primaurelia]|uniref:Tetratricopeptide repeat protein n=1 Tax=Paramecium primaurelia TaxID=5886 RepID=A0A8S1MEH9_PARPR|nr:unnamed protein product [Paramecium primaurelia]
MQQSHQLRSLLPTSFNKKLIQDNQIDHAQEEINKDSKYAETYQLRGLIHLKIEEKHKALDDLNQVIYHNPSLMTTIYQKNQMLDKELEDCDQAIKIKPDYALAYSKKESKNNLMMCISGLEICPSNPPYFTIIGDLDYQDLQYEKVNVTWNSNQMELIRWINIFIKLQLQNLQEIDCVIIKAKKQISYLPNSSAQYKNQFNEYFKRVERIERSVSVIVLPNDETQRQEMQKNMIKQFQEIIITKRIIKAVLKIKQYLHRIYDGGFKKPKNKHQFIYFKSLLWIFYFYMHAVGTFNNLILSKQRAFVESTSEKVLSLIYNAFKAGSKRSFNIINSVLKNGVEYQKEAKFKRRIIRLKNIMKLFAVTPTEFEFTQFLEKISLLENSSKQYNRDSYWKQGTADFLKLQKYIEENNDMIIIEDQDKKLRQLLIDAILKNYNSISKKIKVHFYYFQNRSAESMKYTLLTDFISLLNLQMHQFYFQDNIAYNFSQFTFIIFQVIIKSKHN